MLSCSLSHNLSCFPAIPALAEPRAHFSSGGINGEAGAVVAGMSRSEGLIALCQLPRGQQQCWCQVTNNLHVMPNPTALQPVQCGERCRRRV